MSDAMRNAFAWGWMQARDYYGISERDTPRGQVDHGAECDKVGNDCYVCTCDEVEAKRHAKVAAADAYPITLPPGGSRIVAYDPDADQGRGGWRIAAGTRDRAVFTGELYRIVERSIDGVRAIRAEWQWNGTIDGKPRTYRTLSAARIARTKVQAAYDKHGIPMEVAVQRAPIGQWEVVT